MPEVPYLRSTLARALSPAQVKQRIVDFGAHTLRGRLQPRRAQGVEPKESGIMSVLGFKGKPLVKPHSPGDPLLLTTPSSES